MEDVSLDAWKAVAISLVNLRIEDLSLTYWTIAGKSWQANFAVKPFKSEMTSLIITECKEAIMHQGAQSHSVKLEKNTKSIRDLKVTDIRVTENDLELQLGEGSEPRVALVFQGFRTLTLNVP